MRIHTLAAGTALALSLAGTATLMPAQAQAATSHATAERAGTFTVTATVNKAEPLAGSKVKIKGSVKPAAPGAKVVLQLRYADQKAWKTVDTSTLSKASKFKFKDKVKTVRERKYRVVKPAGPNRGAGHSKALKVTVFGWRNLTSLSPATASSAGETNSVTMNGTAYPDSLRTFAFGSPAQGSIEYNLNRDCKTFTGRAGLDDSSPATGSASVTMSADGAQKYTGSFGLTQSAAVSFDLTKAFRLSISATTLNGGIAAVGTPQVLCSF